MKKKILSLLLTLCLAMTFVPMAAFAEETQNISVWDGNTAAAFAGGTGTAEDPYQIANGAQLAYLASSVNNGETYEAKNFVLTANIDLNGLPWTPIANSFSDALLGGRIIASLPVILTVRDIPSLMFPLGQRPHRLNRMYLGCLAQQREKSVT